MENKNIENKNRVWIYCRIDAPEDTHGALKEQRKQLMDYADQMGFETAGCSEDTAGGMEFDRPGLKRFTEAAEQGNMNILIIRDLSRIGRSVCEAVEYLNRLKQMGWMCIPLWRAGWSLPCRISFWKQCGIRHRGEETSCSRKKKPTRCIISWHPNCWI